MVMVVNLSTFSSKFLAFKVVILLLIFLSLTELALRAVGTKPKVWFGKTPEQYLSLVNRAKRDQDLGKKVLVVTGDSRIEWSLSPEKMQEYLGNDYQVYNLAYPGAAVRPILDRFIEYNFFPDVLVVGYSHLSVIWSTATFFPIVPTSFETTFNSAIFSWLSENLVSFSPKNWTANKANEVDWIDKRSISEKGQAHIVYRLNKNEAVDEQKKWYSMMYSKKIEKKELDFITYQFEKAIDVFKGHGTKVILLRMPVGQWALEQETKNDPISLSMIAKDLKIPVLDFNLNPDRLNWNYYDDIHVAPPDDITVSAVVSQFIQQSLSSNLFESSTNLIEPNIQFQSGWASPERSRSWSQKSQAFVRIRPQNYSQLEVTLHTVRPRKIAIFMDGAWVRTLKLKTQDFQKTILKLEPGENLKELKFITDEPASHALNGDPQPYTFFVDLELK